MKVAAYCLYLTLLIGLATVVGACQMVTPPAPGAVSATAPPAADEPRATELTLETLAGLWEQNCMYTDVNPDGTYTTWSGLPQPGGFPKEAGYLELDGKLLTIHSGEDGLLCRNQNGTYEVTAWNSDEYQLALVADECPQRREGGAMGTYRRVAGADYDPEGGIQLGPCDDFAVESPEGEPSAASAELTLETLAGLWLQEQAGIHLELNADGTYKAWAGLPQSGGFPKEAGNLKLDGNLLTFHSTGDGLLCQNQSGTYEVVAWSSEEFELALVTDECAQREGNPNGSWKHVPATGK